MINELIDRVRLGKVSSLEDLRKEWVSLNQNYTNDFLDRVWDIALLNSWNGACLENQVLWLQMLQPVIDSAPQISTAPSREVEETQKEEIITWMNRVDSSKVEMWYRPMTLVLMEEALELRQKLPHLNINYFHMKGYSKEEGYNGEMIPVLWDNKCNAWFANGPIVRKILLKTPVFVA